MRPLLVFLLLLVASMFCAWLAYACFRSGQRERTRPAELTRIVLSFEGVNDQKTIEAATAMLGERLRHAGAAEVKVETQGTNEVRLEFRPITADELEIEGGVRLTRRGHLRFLVQAESEKIFSSTLTREHQKLHDWRSANPGVALGRFDSLAPEAGGPVRGLHWCTTRRPGDADLSDERFIPLVEPKAEWCFGAADLAIVGHASDALGYPAVAFEMKRDRTQAFSDFTESITGRTLAIVLDGEVLMLATVQSRLPGKTVISVGRGGFTTGEANVLIAILRSGELPAEPTLVSTDHVAVALSERWMTWYAAAIAVSVLTVILLLFGVSLLRTPQRDGGNATSSKAADWSSPGPSA